MAENQPVYESQKQRWMKYGANVAVASIVVVLLAAAVIWLAERVDARVDTTQAGMYSLKPQTLNIIRNLDQKVKLVSLYTSEAEDKEKTDYAQPVADLLEEYKRKGKNIEIEIIDPVANPSKVDSLVAEVSSKYGGEVQQYKDAVEAYRPVAEKIVAAVTQEQARLAKLAEKSLGTEERIGPLHPAIQSTIDALRQDVERTTETIDRRLKLKVPDYKGAISAIESRMEDVSQSAEAIASLLDKAKGDEKVPAEGKQYATDSHANYQELKQLADETLTKLKSLGELKLDELRQKLNEENAILVLGENDMRSISSRQVWQTDAEDVRRFAEGAEIKPRFAGEQQITTAILSLTAKTRPKVAFVRPGGAPLTTQGFPPFQPNGPFSRIANRLRDYNFEVLEKDLSGMWEMQSQMRGMPAEPEPSDEQIKDAVWVVLSIPTGGGPMQMPTAIAPKVLEHLKSGGSALFLFAPQAENMSEVLKEWGVEVDTGAIAVHEFVPSTGGPSRDMIEEAQRVPFIFVTREYGDHVLTKPLRSLDSLILPIHPVKTTGLQGHKGTALLPLPESPKTWGERDIDAALSGDAVKFDETTDMPPPLFGGAAVERDNGGRIVVIGSMEFATNRILTLPDPELAQRGYVVSRFPGNAELLANSIFWLARMDTLIAISPAAMEVSRIEPMSDGALRAWRVGALLVGIPGAVIVAGIMVYFARRD